LNFVQILWGAVFCLPFGFSFTALRLSTWVCGALCLCGTYLLLQDLRISRRDSLIGTAALAAYPIFFLLSFTFMTDVPFLTAMIWSFVAFARALRWQDDKWLLAALVFAAMSVGIRVVGLVLPIAMMITLLVHGGTWGRRSARFLWPVLVFPFFGLLMWWHQGHIEHIADLTWIDNAPDSRLRNLILYGWRFFPAMLLSTTTFLAGAIGLALLPLAVTLVRRSHLLWSVLTFAAIWFLVLATRMLGENHFPPLASGSTWTLGELGATEPLVPGFEPFPQPGWFAPAITAVSFASFSVLLPPVVRSVREQLAFFWWVILGKFLLFALLWLFYDRYALSFLPLFIVLLLSSGKIRLPTVAVGLLATISVYSLFATRDHLSYNRALWEAVDRMRHMAAISEIDGGYVVNGWLQYAHPENAPRDVHGAVAVPRVNVTSSLPYVIANRPLGESRIIGSFPYRRWLGRSGRLYLLERDRAPAVGPGATPLNLSG
jgi:hypothetical protein